ncbi:MAG: hypothetical protein J5842_09230, partial [Lachnospiraceae bacterium]|nr:hypothetical protein [Lachnospiraceae bacterium]
VSPYSIEILEHSYKFENSGDAQKGLNYSDDYAIPRERYDSIYGNMGWYMHWWYNDDPWCGSCYGLAGSSALISSEGNGITLDRLTANAGSINEASITGRDNPDENIDKLKRFIEEVHISQYDSRIQSALYYNADLEGAIRCIERDGHPVILGLYGPIPGYTDLIGGHAVLAYATEKADNGVINIHIYDSNWPGEDRVIHVAKSSARYDLWSYDLGPDSKGGKVLWGTVNNTGGRIVSQLTYVPYDVYSAVLFDHGKYKSSDWTITGETAQQGTTQDGNAWTDDDEKQYENLEWDAQDQALYDMDPWTEEEEKAYSERTGIWSQDPVSDEAFEKDPWTDEDEEFYDKYGAGDDAGKVWTDEDEENTKTAKEFGHRTLPL